VSVLAYRAEQAVLGAILRDPSVARSVDFVVGGDFSWRRNGQVCDVIGRAQEDSADAWPFGLEFWRDAIRIALHPDQPDLYLGELEKACPVPVPIAFPGIGPGLAPPLPLAAAPGWPGPELGTANGTRPR
jgi:hypothetical protein